MLSGEHIICLAIRRWDSTRKNNQKVMSHLARSNRVLYVNPPRSVRGALDEALRRVPRLQENGTTENLVVYQEPLSLPGWGRAHSASAAYNRLTDPLRFRHIRQTADRLGFRSPILWSFTPLASRAVGRLGEKLVVYSVIDNYDEYFSPTEIWRTVARTGHREMLSRADVVFAVSEGLLEQCLPYNRNSYLAPSAVDVEAFETARQTASLPPDVRSIPRPILGVVGGLRATIDFELLDTLARRHPDYSLMLVGPTEALNAVDAGAFNTLRGLPNVYYLGAKPPDAVPAYVNSCDVGLIPFRIDTFTSYGDPQRLYEYFACGKPVVSTAMPSVRRFVPLALVAGSPAEFVAAVEDVLARPDGRSDARVTVAHSNGLDRRIGQMSAILAEHLAHDAWRSGQHGVRTPRRAARWQWTAKRALDVIVSGISLFILAPVLAAIAAAIRLTSPGPVLYRWPVVGEGGRPLRAYKFRTMVVGADGLKSDLLDRNEATGPVFKMRADPRITAVGRILRKFSLDELPQLWSVLLGDLSLVGPRPVLRHEWEQMTPWQRRKLSTKPGIVCLWHLRGQPRDFDEWVKLDLEYVDNWSLWLDLKLIVWTPLYMLSGRNY